MTAEAIMPPKSVEDINLYNELLFEQGYSHEAFRILRRDNQISWTPPTEMTKGSWNLVKYQDVLYVSRHPELFSSEKGIVQYEPLEETDATAPGAGNG